MVVLEFGKECPKMTEMLTHEMEIYVTERQKTHMQYTDDAMQIF